MNDGIIRIGLIGLGQRGLATLRRYGQIEGARIVAVSDLSSEAVAQARQLLEQAGTADVEAYQGESQWRRLCESRAVDLVIVCTDWASHARMAVYAMQQGKHVALEVPAAMSVRECWELVRTAQATQRHCTMLENCCYDVFHLGIMGMVRQGLFGDITHCEGAYIHDLRLQDNWRQLSTHRHQGNPYPTHGLGPACQILDVNRTDRLTTLVSMTGLNHINNTLLQTRRGRSILIQFDEHTPRPYSRLQTLCGTEGFAQKYPRPTLQLAGQTAPAYDAEAEAAVQRYIDADMRRLIADGERLGVPNLMNYVMDRRLIGALRHGRPLDISVHDAALWSCVTELSALSVSQGSRPVAVPDFLC